MEEGDFIARWVHPILFFQADPWIFTACYTAFGVLVIVSLILAPPRWRLLRTATVKQ